MCISALFSLAKFMRRTQAVTIIQKYRRMYVERKRYRQKQAAALAMQTILRAYMARQKYQAVRHTSQNTANYFHPNLLIILLLLSPESSLLKTRRNHHYISNKKKELFFKNVALFCFIDTHVYKKPVTRERVEMLLKGIFAYSWRNIHVLLSHSASP